MTLRYNWFDLKQSYLPNLNENKNVSALIDYGDVIFSCASGSFIPANRKCDGQLDCPGTKDDEPNECGNGRPLSFLLFFYFCILIHL